MAGEAMVRHKNRTQSLIISHWWGSQSGRMKEAGEPYLQFRFQSEKEREKKKISFTSKAKAQKRYCTSRYKSVTLRPERQTREWEAHSLQLGKLRCSFCSWLGQGEEKKEGCAVRLQQRPGEMSLQSLRLLVNASEPAGARSILLFLIGPLLLPLEGDSAGSGWEERGGKTDSNWCCHWFNFCFFHLEHSVWSFSILRWIQT